LHFLRLRRMSEPNQFDICDEYPNGWREREIAIQSST
jgi:hypothetical protein